jgi:hypothetical protein
MGFKNTLTTIILSGALALGISGCADKNKTISEEGTITERIATSQKGGNQTLFSYNGMINDSVFSVSHTGTAAVNNYYPTNRQNFTFINDTYNIEKVTPDSLVISYKRTNR